MAAPFRLRALRLCDFDRLLEVERACFGADAYDRALFREYYSARGTVFLAAEGSHRLLGYAPACVRGDRGELVSIAVNPPDRGIGAASALLESVCRRLRRRGAVRLSLMVREDNTAAQALYTRYGFRRARRVRGYYEDSADGLLMLRTLQGAAASPRH
jgi:[ribosomal protein S18]-alanine N-acetyltransferase